MVSKLQKSLGLLFPAMRISIALALLTACILLSADMLGYTLDEDGMALENRKQISESLAIQFSVMEPHKEIEKIEGLIRLIVERNPAILSAGIRHKSDMIIFQSPRHAKLYIGGRCQHVLQHLTSSPRHRERNYTVQYHLRSAAPI